VVASDFKVIAAALGKDGAGERQREQHTEQRSAYRTVLEARRRRHARARSHRPHPDEDRSRRLEVKP
jgi:hypothetical protein